MIASLEAQTNFAPVPRVEIRVEDGISWDAGGPDTTGPDSLDGGGASTSGTGFDAGSPSTMIVDLPPGTDRFTVWRRADGRRMKVRGAVNRAYTGALGIQDVEAPFEVVSSYEVECFSGGTAIGTVPLGSVVLPRLEGEQWRTLIQQPLNPHLWAIVEEVDVNVPSVERSASGELVLTEGASYPSLIGFGPRRGVEGAELVLAADTRDVAARVWATLGTETDPQLQVWLIRSNHPLLPKVFFCNVANLRETSFNIHIGGEQSRFLSTVTEIAPPAPGLVVASLSYDDLDVSFAEGGYDAMDAAFDSYNDRDTAWSLAGAAG